MFSTAYRRVLVDPASALADQIRRELTVTIFIPDEFRHGSYSGAGNRGGAAVAANGNDKKQVQVFVPQPDGFLVPRFWTLGRNEPDYAAYPTWADPELLKGRPLMAGVTPRPLRTTGKMQPGDQTTIRDAVVASWDKCGGAMVRRWCGGGKTEIAMSAWHTHRMHLKGSTGKLGVLVAGLGDMWLKRAKSRFPEASIVLLSGETKPTQAQIDQADIIIVSMHMSALSKRFKDYKLNIDYLMVDEAHDIGGAKLMESAQNIGMPRYLFAMTATPDRWDGMGKLIYWLFGPKMPEFPRPPPKYNIYAQIVHVVMPSTDNPSGTMPPCMRRFGKAVFDRNMLFDYLHKSDVWITAIIKTIMWHHSNVGPTIVFVRRLQTLKDVALTLEGGMPNLKVATLYGETKKKDRVLDDPVDVILAYVTVGRQGHDWPFLRGVIFATGLCGSNVQDAGRGRRDHPDKQHLWITYLCPTDRLDRKSSPSAAHEKSVDSAFKQAEFYMRARSENDGLHCDSLRFVNPDFKPVPPFIDMLALDRKTKPSRDAEDRQQQQLEAGTKRAASGNGNLLKMLAKKHKTHEKTMSNV